MPTIIDGSTGIDQIQDGAVQTADLAAGAVTASKLSGGQSGAAPVFGCRAFVNFVGATGAINASGNIASVVRLSTGSWQITFVIPMQDAFYTVELGWGPAANGNTQIGYESNAVTKTSGTFSVCMHAAGSAFDPANVHVVVHR